MVIPSQFSLRQFSSCCLLTHMFMLRYDYKFGENCRLMQDNCDETLLCYFY